MALRLRSSLLSFSKEVFRKFIEDRGPLFAAAISFYGLISLIPLMLLAIGVFGYVIGHEGALQNVLALARNLIPSNTKDLEQILRELSVRSGLLSGLGLLGLLWTGSQVFVILQQVMNIALHAGERVSFLRGRLVAVATVIVVGALFILSIGITSMLTAIRSYDVTIRGIGPDDILLFWNIVSVLVTVLFSMLAFTIAYRFLPTRRVGLKGPMVGGVTAGLLFDLAKYAFQYYVAHFSTYDRLYGPLAGIIIIVIWIYYVSLITVIGAEVASIYVRHRVNGED